MTTLQRDLIINTTRPLVLIESPYSHPHRAGIELHRAYLELCLFDSINNYNECPVATHKLYTSCLDDNNPIERQIGMEMLHILLFQTEYHVIYFDLGISRGMEWGIGYALKNNKDIQYRSLYGRTYIPPDLLTQEHPQNAPIT